MARPEPATSCERSPSEEVGAKAQRSSDPGGLGLSPLLLGVPGRGVPVVGPQPLGRGWELQGLGHGAVWGFPCRQLCWCNTAPRAYASPCGTWAPFRRGAV